MRVNYFPRDLSPWISPWLLSLGLQLWQLLQKEVQMLNSCKSEDPWQLFFPCQGITQSRKVAVNPEGLHVLC